MAETFTAELCRFLAPQLGRGRRLAIAALATFAGLSAFVVPVALAGHPRRHRRGVAVCPGAHARIGRTPRPVLQAAVVCLVNVQRLSRGLPRLRESSRLNRSAQGWTNVMVRIHSFTHGSDFASRISAVGFSWSQAGENIATGYRTPASVVRAWMRSPDHCRNILSPVFLDVGTGVSLSRVGAVSGPGTWTQDFGLPFRARLPSANTAPANGCPY